MKSSEAWDERLLFPQLPDICPPLSYPSSSTTTNLNDEIQSDSEEHDENEVDSDKEGANEDIKAMVQGVSEKFGEPYSSMNEPFPKVPAYRPSFAKVEDLCTEIFNDATTLLEASDYQDKYTQHLLDVIRRRQDIKYDKPKRIGNFGDSGVGKSSLINAILDSPDLASAGATGSALTCVITEFMAPSPMQETPFMATIELFGQEQIQEMLKENLEAYIRFHHESIDGMDEEEIQELKCQANTAQESFLAMFAPKSHFQSEESARKYLSSATLTDCSAILESFSLWIQEFMEKYKPRNDLLFLTASTAEQLNSQLEPWVTSNPQSEAYALERLSSWWPIVRIVRVGLHSLLLERGIVVADLPGLGDTNRVRTKATRRYMRDSDYFFFAAKIARAQTDENVYRRLMTAYKMFGSRKALITTMIDDIPSTTKPRSLTATAKETERYHQLSQAFALAGTKKSRLTSLGKKQRGRQLAATETKMHKLTIKKKIYSALIHQSLVEMRNKKVGVAVRKAHKEMTSDPGFLSIFYVSSAHYEKHLRGYDEEDIPLPVMSTGILQFRYMVTELPANGKLNVLRHHWQGNLTSVVDSLGTWSSQSELKVHAESFILSLKEALARTFLTSIRNDLEEWRQKSIEVYDSWGRMNAGSFMAFIRKDGTHKPKKGSYRDWNSELLAPVVQDVSKSWEFFARNFRDCKDDYFARLVKLVDDIRDDLNAIEGVSITPMIPFLESLPSKKEHLSRALMVFFGKLLRLCRDVKLEVIMEDEDGLLMQAMLPLYEKLRQVEDTSPVIRRKTLLKDSIERGEPFARILPGVQQRFEAGLAKLQPELVQSLETVFDMILSDFDLMFVVEELPDPRRDVLRGQVREFVDYARSKIDGEIATEFAHATSGPSYQDSTMD